jgi:adenine-specific DNA-methyltransferase
MTDSNVESTAAEPKTERLDLRSHDIITEKQAEIVRLFPEVRTEGGKIDFDRLRRVLGEVVDPGKERFGMNWPGKADCLKAIQSPSLGTLLPSREESLEFDTTENLIVEGDNLEVLKLMQKAYLGKIKMIYIDPPYNTGNDFIYPDNYSESLQTYLAYTGQVDNEGRKFSTNTEADGRFHSKWMNMMYPRLYLARNLLTEDGVLFVSIDDHELINLRNLCNEIFGEENFVEGFVWKKSYGGGAKEQYAVRQHEFCLLYAKNMDSLSELWLPPDPEAEKKYYVGKDEHFENRGPFRIKPLEATKSMDRRENLIYPIPAPDGTEILPKRQWWWSKERSFRAIQENGLVFTKTEDGWSVGYKQYLIGVDGEKRGAKPFSIIDGIYTQHGTADLRELFDDEVVVQFPKPVALLERLLQIAGDESLTVLDFFAGSGTTAQAALQLNKKDGGSRKYILVQLPEPTGREDFKTISEITRERVRRVVKRLEAAESTQPVLGDVAKDRGFRAFKLAESSFRLWDSSAPDVAEAAKVDALVNQLQLHIDHIRDGRRPEDLLFELLLKSGFPLSTRIEMASIDQKTVYSIAGGALLICLERELTMELIKQLAERKAERVILLDEGFAGNDQLKTNAVQIMKSKGVTSFRTV